ncbi:hypothetical protein CAEBREN_03597 [Caenorhabditis brenneri]|uniref:Ribonuclease H2 subunit B wHTH domain-containing protein n=1 Tax=Caenorhabditis brenneri TaxID=135651 RepID=G0NVK0_CAEBE|nr:hypothetical protein CAEBREN_03597 [Caenorhabditis brenneri]
MPPKTRKTKKEDVEEEEAVEEILEETKPAKLPESDESYDRKIVVAKTGTLPNSRIIKLRHPKEGCALFRLSDTCFDEIIAVNDGHRSFFHGESVIENGTIHLFSPFNPVFICLPYLQKTSQKFVEIEEILVDEQQQFEAIKELAGNEKILKALEQVADVKDLLDVKLFRLNEQKMLEWMKTKFEALKQELQKDAHKSLLDCPEALDRHVFSFFSDFLSPELALQVKSHLNIQDPVATENVDMSMKRKSEFDKEFEMEKPAVKKPKESIQAKKLQVAAKGTKSISAFFGKKN